MKNKVKVFIGGDEYIIIADATEEYIKKTSALVDEKIKEIKANPAATSMSAAVLTAVNFADEYQKAIRGANNMRAQMKDYLDEVGRIQNELNEAKREIRRLQDELKKKQG